MIYSIGYQGMRRADDLIQILEEHQVGILLDVRSKPTSYNSAFRKDYLSRRLSESGIVYRWAGNRLGGFSDACHRLSAATTVAVGKEAQLIDEMEKILNHSNR